MILSLYKKYSLIADYDPDVLRYRIFISYVSTIAQLYIIFGCVLFSIIGYTISNLFDQLHGEIKALSLTSANSFIVRFKRCKEVHALICSLIDGMNDCFSNFMFMAIVFYFASAINVSFNTITSSFWYTNYAGYAFTAYVLLQLLLICYVSYRIQRQVHKFRLTFHFSSYKVEFYNVIQANKIPRELRKLQLSQVQHQQEVGCLSTQFFLFLAIFISN